MGHQIETLAAFVANTSWDDIPAPVRHHTKLVLLDTLGVILAGSDRPEVRQLTNRLAVGSPTGATVFARGWPSLDPRTAALLNGIAARSVELCEGANGLQPSPSWPSPSSAAWVGAPCWVPSSWATKWRGG